MARQIGLKDVYFAKLTKDDDTGVTYETPTHLVGGINAKIAKKYNSENLYSDDSIEDVVSNLESIDVELELSSLPLEARALLQGAKIIKGTLIESKDDIAPEGALLFRSKKSNGKYRYAALFKGKFEPVDDEYATEEDKPKAQTSKIKGTFYPRINDKNHQIISDEDAVGVNQDTLNAWFSEVPVIPTDTTPPTVSTNILDAATGVVVSTNIVWTFSEVINSSYVTAANFFLMKADGTAVAGSLSINEGLTEVTFNPTSDLSASTDYIAVCTTNVKDLAGNALVTNKITNFTTA